MGSFALKNNAEKLMSLPDQGKVARSLQTSSFPSTNSWCYDGTGIRFCDWHFIHRARTNTLPIDRWAKSVNVLEIEIHSLIMQLHKTLSIGAKIYTKDTYTKLFQEILCKTVEFNDFFDFLACNRPPQSPVANIAYKR